MQRLFILLIFFSGYLTAAGQTTNISGIVNSYHAVTEVLYSKACVRVDNTAGLNAGDLVVLIQMKGAAINTSNSSSFGDTTSLNDAGNYELNYICKTIGDSVYLFNNLVNTYTISGKVQLVKFASYYSANVTGTVKPGSWDNSTGKGGVLAIQVEDALTLNANIFADSAGFRGGSFLMSSSTCSNFFAATDYVYDASSNSPQNGGYKGESVSDIPVSVSGGRGAPANGGGGGNNHNNGGGGGANLSGGGNGGGNYATVSGACTGNYQGLGGKPLSSWVGKKIFAGGGGGAGHVNNNIPAYGGGHGGGIVFIIAKDIIGNGYSISANGRAGANGASDGGSGGGAGGTIIMHVLNTYTGPLTIQANGGNGGTADNQNITNRCYGAGGGGSGGAVYFNGATPAITVNTLAGAAGIDFRVVGCGTPVPASAGNSGVIIPGYNYILSSVLSNDCDAVALPVQLISFSAREDIRKVNLEWKVADPENVNYFIIEKLDKNINSWNAVQTVSASLNKIYSGTDENAGYGYNLYRLKIVEHNNSTTYSSIQKVFVDAVNSFSVFPNPAKNTVSVFGKFTSAQIFVIRDISGRIVHSGIILPGANTTNIQLSHLPKGVYAITINSKTGKLIVE